MTIRQRWLGFGIVVLFAIGLIFYKLGEVPHGMTWDEAAIGYNGFAVITTRRDEWLTRVPVSFKSFGDYKAPLAIYVTGMFVTFLGSELWVVRLPFAVAGVLSVIGMVYLLQALLISAGREKSSTVTGQLIGPWSLFGGVLFLTTPWFLHFARTGFESGMALMWIIWGMWAAIQLTLGDQGLIGSVKRRKALICSILISVMSISFVAALYTYHSAKVVVPLLVVTVLVLFFQSWRNKAKYSMIALGLMTVLSWPLIKDSLWGAGGTRLSQASFLMSGMPLTEKLLLMTSHLVVHVSPAFLVGGWTDTLRHGDGQWGVLLLPTLFLVFLGGVFGWRGSSAKLRVWLVSGVWIVAGLGAAALGVDVPHSNRALVSLPGFIIFAVLGGQVALNWIRSLSLEKVALGSHGETKLVSKSISGTLVLVYCLLFVAYQFDYYQVFASQSAEEYKDGYLEAMQIAVQYEKGRGVPKADTVIFTNEYGQPYIYALFARRTNPIWYQGGSLNSFIFTDTINQSDLGRNNTLVVAGKNALVPKDLADVVISGSDGVPRFWIFYPERHDEK